MCRVPGGGTIERPLPHDLQQYRLLLTSSTKGQHRSRALSLHESAELAPHDRSISRFVWTMAHPRLTLCQYGSGTEQPRRISIPPSLLSCRGQGSLSRPTHLDGIFCLAAWRRKSSGRLVLHMWEADYFRSTHLDVCSPFSGIPSELIAVAFSLEGRPRE